MQLYCPNCRRARPLGLRCPKCDERLVSAGEAHEAVLTGRSMHASLPPADTTFGGRIAVGVIAALGTVIALRDLAMGMVGLILGDEFAAAAAPALGVTFATVGAMAGGVLAGAGLARGGLAGGFAGACVGILLTSIAAHAGERPPLGMSDLAVAGGLAVVAALAGQVGTRIWPPNLPLPRVEVRNRSSSVARMVEAAARETVVVPSVQWGRVALGAVLFAFGVWHAEGLRIVASHTPINHVNLGRVASAPTTGGMLAIAAAVIAGLAAGAVTYSGWRHGLYAGLAGAIVIAALLASGDAAMTAPIDSLQLLVPSTLPGGQYALVVGLIVCVTAGGAFGEGLLPVIAPQKKRRMLD